jgi:hypothetical protein
MDGVGQSHHITFLRMAFTLSLCHENLLGREVHSLHCCVSIHERQVRRVWKEEMPQL